MEDAKELIVSNMENVSLTLPNRTMKATVMRPMIPTIMKNIFLLIPPSSFLKNSLTVT